MSILNNSVTMHRTLGLAGHEIMALNSFLTETTISLTLETKRAGKAEAKELRQDTFKPKLDSRITSVPQRDE